jgi:hypothetical protein
MKMALQNWVKKYLRTKPEVSKIFDDLEEYKTFCVDQGYTFNEADLYNERSPYGDFVRTKKGKWPRDNWGYAIRQFKRA